MNTAEYPIHIRLLRQVICLMLLFFFASGMASGAEDNAEITDIVVTNTSSSILLFLNVTNAFSDEMIRGIHNGIPVTIEYHVKITRERKGWLDQELVEAVYEHRLQYDTLKEEYRVEFSENPGKVVRTKELQRAMKLMASLNSVAVAPLSLLVPDEEYTLKVKAEQAEKKLPFYFHYVIPFWGLWKFETDWYSVRFRY